MLERYGAWRAATAADDARFRCVGEAPELDGEARDELSRLGYADGSG
jgi:hypothetical protein